MCSSVGGRIGLDEFGGPKLLLVCFPTKSCERGSVADPGGGGVGGLNTPPLQRCFFLAQLSFS